MACSLGSDVEWSMEIGNQCSIPLCVSRLSTEKYNIIAAWSLQSIKDGKVELWPSGKSFY